MPYTAPAAVVSGAVISKTTFGDVVIADLNFLANKPACRVTKTTQSLTDATEATAAFDTETYDTDVMHDNVTNNSRITIKTAGVFSVAFVGTIDGAADYARLLAYIRLNGTTNLGGVTIMNNSASLAPQLNVAFDYKFAVNDYIEVRVFQDNTAGAARNLTAAAFTASWQCLG